VPHTKAKGTQDIACVAGGTFLREAARKGRRAREKSIYYIDTDEIPGFFLLLNNHIFIARSEDTIFIFHV